MTITLAEKIAAIERAISDWDGCAMDITARDRPALEAVLADLRAQKVPSLRCDECDNGIEANWEYCSWCGLPTDGQIRMHSNALARRAGAEEMRERAAKVARDACLVPPDGGSPTEEERQLCDRIEAAIRALPVE